MAGIDLLGKNAARFSGLLGDHEQVGLVQRPDESRLSETSGPNENRRVAARRDPVADLPGPPPSPWIRKSKRRRPCLEDLAEIEQSLLGADVPRVEQADRAGPGTRPPSRGVAGAPPPIDRMEPVGDEQDRLVAAAQSSSSRSIMTGEIDRQTSALLNRTLWTRMEQPWEPEPPRDHAAGRRGVRGQIHECSGRAARRYKQLVQRGEGHAPGVGTERDHGVEPGPPDAAIGRARRNKVSVEQHPLPDRSGIPRDEHPEPLDLDPLITCPSTRQPLWPLLSVHSG